MKRALSALATFAYPVLILILLRRFASSIPAYAEIGLKLYPVAVNATLFTVFFRSLYQPQTVIEKMARIRKPDLDARGVAYTRKVTQVWCAFLAANGLVALGLAFFAATETWALYTGLIAYVLMGLLFAVEWLVRQRVQHAQP